MSATAHGSRGASSAQPETVQLGPAARAPFHSELHRHSHSTLHVVTGGSGAHRVEGGEERLRPPQLMLLGEGQAHGWRVPEPPRGIAIQFTGEMLDRDVLLPEAIRTGIALGAPAVRPGPSGWARVRTLLELLRTAERTPVGRHAANMLLGAVLLEAFAELPEPRADGVGWSDRSERAILRTFQIAVRGHPSATRNVGWYARSLGVPERQLAVIVRRHAGDTPGKLVRTALADEAGRILRTTDLPVHRIAAQLGFTDPAYFSRFLLRELGARPREYRAARDQ